MTNPEQQPNITNLQTLESELTLTKQEMEEFRKLPKEEQEKQKDKKFARLQELQVRLEQSIQEAIQSGDAQKAQELKDQLESEIKDLERMMEEIEISPEDKIIFQKIREGNFTEEDTAKLTTVTMEIAEILINFRVDVDLELSGLTLISDSVAECLSGYFGGLNLKGLVTISDNVAEQLSKHSGQIWLNGLKSISDTIADHLSKIQGDLFLGGPESISDSVAEILSKHRGGVLSLWNLKSLSDVAAKSLSECQQLWVKNDDIKAQINKFKSK